LFLKYYLNDKVNKMRNSLHLNNFVQGYRSDYLVQPEERGFNVTGNVGALLNSDPALLKTINDGILVNVLDRTSNPHYLPTPQIYNQNDKRLSELLSHYPNGVPNVVLQPDQNMQIGNVASSTLAGISTFGINNSNVLNDNRQDIGHEIEAYGLANENGSRALGEGKWSCYPLEAGLNIPSLKVEKNANNAYVASPQSFSPYVPLYQVGNWTKIDNGNFLKEFNDKASCLLK